MADHSSQDSDLREVRIGRILSDLHERRQRGESIDDEQILAENPDLTNELCAHLATLRQLRSEERSITRLIRQGVLSNPIDPRYRATFGDYQVIEYLGHGGMGVVLKAYDEKLRRVVAIKLLRRELADDDLANARFLREARAAALLTHPNIAGVYAVGEHNGSPFIAMEYVDGPSLSHVIRQGGPLGTEKIRSLFGQLLTGLAAAHDAGLVHRDIKSANLLLVDGANRHAGPGSDHGEILKIADFGLARIASSQTQLTLDNHSFGTPEYMSPEQARGEPDVDHRSDLYSAGVVLYEMITGRTPFRANSPTALIHQILELTPQHPRSVHPGADPALSSLAMRLMAKRREDRFDSATDVLIALRSNRRIANKQVWRRLAWTLGACIALIGLFGALSLLMLPETSLGSVTPRIEAVRSDSGRNLQVFKRGVGIWQNLHSFPEHILINGVALADVDGRGQQLVVAAIDPPEEGKCVFAFDASGDRAWSENMSSTMQWPDCNPPKAFTGIHVLACDLDSIPGDELIVVASDIGEYPTRVSILDPKVNPPRVIGTLWHFGDIPPNAADNGRIQLIRDYWGDGRPALLAMGLNNKLDGFVQRHEFAPQCWTKWDIVSSIMILDFTEIMRLGECVGPPATDLVDLPQGGVYAYAFLNMAHTDGETDIPDMRGRQRPELRQQGALFNLVVTGPAGEGEGESTIQVGAASRRERDGVSFTLDRNLRIDLAYSAASTRGRSEAEWRDAWVPVIQKGQWLKPPARP